MLRKGAAIGAVIIIMSQVFIPALNSTAEQADDTEKLCAEITEYRADGSAVQHIVTLTRSMVEDLRTALLETPNQEKRFDILRKYGLLPEGANLDEWQSNMMHRADAIGFDRHDAYDIAADSAKLGLFKLPILLNFFCMVNGVYMLGGSAGLGLPPLLGFLKFFGSTRIISMDLVDMCWGAIGMLETKGLLRQHSLVMVPSFLFMAGFVGIHIHIPLVLNLYNGFSAMTFATGLGPHSIKFNLASSVMTTFILGTMLGLLFGQPTEVAN